MSRGHGESWDVIVIGAGPAGTAAGAMLAEKGRRVLVLEKEKLPRYHIGESLIPFCWFPLQRLGLLEKLDAASFQVRKYSVQFIGLDGVRSKPFYFFEHSAHDSSRTWQVVRADFDRMLVDNAVEKGVELRTETAARDLIVEDGVVRGVVAADRGGTPVELRARVTVDASGRDIFSQSKYHWRKPDEILHKAAIWTYYRGALRDPGIDEGATTIAYVPEKGWFWYIPLPEDLVSVGVVAEKSYLYKQSRDPETIFDREVELQPWIKAHLQAGRRIEGFKVTGDYCYRSQHCATDGLVLVGDAFAFLDPVFSSGVFLALHSGVMAADAVDAALREGDVSAGRFREYGRRLCRNVEAMRCLVYAFYDPEFSFADFFQKYPQMRSNVTDCLMGDLDRDFDPMFRAMAEFARIPEPLPHGLPAATAATRLPR